MRARPQVPRGQTFDGDAIQRRYESDDDPMAACARLRIDASIRVDVAAAVA
jgi:hypothetical protein